MIIAYVGSLSSNDNAYRRLKAIQQLGIETSAFDVSKHRKCFGYLANQFAYRLNMGPIISALNDEVVRETRKKRPDILWLDNRVYLHPTTVAYLRQKGTFVVNILTDDPFGIVRVGWQLTKKVARYVDLHFVQRTVNVSEFMALGANKVLECDRSFDSELHRPIQLNEEDKKHFSSDILFVGSWAKNRASVLAELVKRGFPISIWGNNWKGNKYWNELKNHYRGGGLSGDDYPKAINATKIALHFLRQENRDDQDSRTFEIPACGAFMLAERTPKHCKYFKEGVEAEFFESISELESKIRYYLIHEIERKKIAAAARQRSLMSDYSHQSRIKYILSEISQMTGKGGK